ncbi:MAG: c-type cytochrome [Acidobacteria bacterium]|nr:c-type cytochrome [Acidobacteriota bacterium]
MRLLAVLLLASPLFAQPLAQGRALFLDHCAPCHGEFGAEGFGANLAIPDLPRAPDDRTLARLIRNGLEGTDMTPAFGVTDSEVKAMIAYVRSLGRTPRQPVPGDAGRGSQIYQGKGNCAQCHMLRGSGGRHGPDLSDIGLRRSPAHLRQSLTDPEAAFPHGYLYVEVTTRAGRNIAGARVNEDSFSIQLRDLAGDVHSFWKSELSDLKKHRDRSSMPAYKSLSQSELTDLVAYLASLRGRL